jgi:predicted ribosomally synthesized peptide with SipW-like signal peptide
MRRILFPLLVIGLAAGLFTLGSGAFFSDTATDTGNTITAGTIVNTITGATCTISNQAPGTTGISCSKTINNTGSLSATLDLEFDVVDSEPTADVAPEVTAEGSALGADIGKYMVITVFTVGGVDKLASFSTDGACHGTNNAGHAVPSGRNLCDLDKANVLAAIDTIAGGASKVVALTITFDSTAGNEHQGDQTAITIASGLRQAADSATDPIPSENGGY